ncbi:MAG TPA: 1-deoxy-D-xylulose-5-phosphate reductoisomerase [Balneolales bacterium]|nr:1-deoxy-D-xylulose-5-phosphate reductoisomerase [Balneolales bacterium]
MIQHNIVLLGSTGSIGKQALELIRENKEKFKVYALTANASWKTLAQQINEFKPEYAVIADDTHYANLCGAVSHHETEILSGQDYLEELVTHDEVTLVLNSLVGFSGFMPTFTALEHNKRVALANKESLVVGGQLINERIRNKKDLLIPVDSEHSAIFQCLSGESKNQVEKLIITASGGPFRTWSYEQMKQITVEQALKHPNWNMGAKITIDSSTMMNKGLEVIEAYWLFGVPLSRIETVVHPQSIIHSMVQFIDGSTKAQMGPPDMKVPILYAMSYPERIEAATPRMDWSVEQEITFEPVDYKRFPCLRIAREALKMGGCAPAVLNASNEIAVQRFLNREITYIQIPNVIESSLSKLANGQKIDTNSLLEIDAETREFASSIN